MRSRRERGILILIFALSVGLIMLGVFIMGQYEYSVLTSYAKQQDSYVKLVLDQINLQADRSDDEIIENILASLGNGDTSYWAFSKEQTILYIKNVTETYQYKGITMESYFSSNTRFPTSQSGHPCHREYGRRSVCRIRRYLQVRRQPV